MALLSRARRAAWIVLGCSAVAQAPAAAQGREPEYAVKAAYLLSFLNYVEWPATAPAGGPMRVCVMGADPIGDNLQALIDERPPSRGRRVVAQQVARPVEAEGCHVGFIPVDATPAPAVWLEALDGQPVLTVGEDPDFAKKHGGIIRFVFVGQTIRFEVNLAAARAAGFQISSRLLRLANTVYE